jgi:hypothetical protein
VPKPGTVEGNKVTLQDLENATHPEEEPPPQQPNNPRNNLQQGTNLKMTPEEEAAAKGQAGKGDRGQGRRTLQSEIETRRGD